ncbi:MAG: 30S ribosomal protein S6 [Verrucomicrobia subdivision 3 bacterium]|nr:30S ribosomal protein S6 [Limisphaerales bacterium]
MKRYDGLFIIDTTGQSDSVDEHITKLNGLISEAGGKVTNEQKIGRRGFVRIANKRHKGGFYVNLQFELEGGALEGLRKELDKRPEFFRAQITRSTGATLELAAS